MTSLPKYDTKPNHSQILQLQHFVGENSVVSSKTARDILLKTQDVKCFGIKPI